MKSLTRSPLAGVMSAVAASSFARMDANQPQGPQLVMPPKPIANYSVRQLFDNYGVVFNQWEASRGTYYDAVAYPAAGLAQALLFQNPIGAAGGVLSANKTQSDTNMNNAGVLPQNIMFLIDCIDIHVQPSTPTVAADLPAVFGAQRVANNINDVWIIRRSGNFKLTIGTKDYCQEAPLATFPPLSRLHVSGAFSDVSTAGASFQNRAVSAEVQGTPYVLDPQNLLIPPLTNFAVRLGWDEGVQAITNPARIFVRLNGTLFRKIQ